MKELHESSAKIYIEWLSEVQRILKSQGKKYTSGDGGDIDKLMKAISVIGGMPKSPPTENVPRSKHFQVNESWIKIVYEELYKFNAHGDEYICSTTEAIIKVNGIKRLFDNFSNQMYFRGEQNFGWELTSRLGRSMNIDWDKTDFSKVTQEELDIMEIFQKKVNSTATLKEEIFGDKKIIESYDSGWWSIMQHYDDDFGTRLIDVTSSVFCALYFACVDWDGNIDESVDGKLYFFPNQMGRGESENPDLFKGEIIGTEDLVNNSLKEYFTIDPTIDFLRFRVSPIRNDRALAQDGYFIWQPKFDLPLNLTQNFPFRVHRSFKSAIAKELKAMGYTKERILSKNRFGFQHKAASP